MSDPVAFISYSTQDQTVAGLVCQALEQEHIPCWIAPRNVPVGENAFDAIPEGVAGCKVLVLILSESAMKSKYVQRELQIALDYKKVIIPFRIEDVKLGGAVHFMLTGVQWLDAFVPPIERHVAVLVARVAAIVNAEGGNVPYVQPVEVTAEKKKGTNWYLRAAIAGVAVVALAIAGYFGIYRQSDASIQAAVAQRLQAALNQHGILIDCASCASSQAHVNVLASDGIVTLTGAVAQPDEALVHGVSLDVRGVRSVTYSLEDIPGQSVAGQNASGQAPAVAANRTPNQPSLPAGAPAPAAKPEATPKPAAAPSAPPAQPLTAEEYRARAAVMTGQQKMQEQDFVSAENYFRLALNLDSTNQSAKAGLASARKALGED